MPKKLVNLLSIDFREFGYDKVKPGLFNSMYIAEKQFDGLCDFLAAVKTETHNIMDCTKPLKDDLEMMGVRRDEIGYRSITVQNIEFDKHRAPKDWKYKLVFLTIDDNDDGPGMALGDTWYSREEARNLK